MFGDTCCHGRSRRRVLLDIEDMPPFRIRGAWACLPNRRLMPTAGVSVAQAGVLDKVGWVVDMLASDDSDQVGEFDEAIWGSEGC
jgi:hypothetical protein